MTGVPRTARLLRTLHLEVRGNCLNSHGPEGEDIGNQNRSNLRLEGAGIRGEPPISADCAVTRCRAAAI